MKGWNWCLLLFVLLVVVLVNPFKLNLREFHGGRGRWYGRGYRYGYGGGDSASALNPLYYGYDEDYYYVLPKYFPFPLGY